MDYLSILGWLVTILALCSAGYSVLSAYLAGRFAHKPDAEGHTFPAATILKPLHGAEAALEENLASFFEQDYPAPFQLVFGVQDENDVAIAVVERLRRRYPEADAALVVDSRRHGANAKVSNLINMHAQSRHDVFILSDSDIAVRRDYLRKLAGALEPADVGAVTCLYTGWGAEGLSSRLCAMGIDYQFLPNAIVAISFGLAEPCSGSTIALKRAVLEEIGGLEAFAGYLADDYEMGRAVRASGRRIAIPAMTVKHACSENNVRDWLAHELRWARTIRVVAPSGHAGSIVTYAIPLGLMGIILSGFTVFALISLAATLAARAVLKWRIDQLFGCNGGPLWLLPVRDVLSFGVFVVSLFGRSVEWRGERLQVKQDGALLNR